MKNKNIKEIVKESYAKIAKKSKSCSVFRKPSCCGSDSAEYISKNIGYSEKELKSVPEGANLGLGCGNPVALASLKEGDIVLDLGSGAGFDCFLVANKVGHSGRVIGIDMTPEMIEKARENARKGKYKNVEFRRAEIENLPVPDNSVDVIISNCVINLSPDKEKVFKEAFRVLKPGGRLMVSDIVWLKEVPDFVKDSIDAYVGCLGGAIRKDEYLGAIKKAGFQEAEIISETKFPVEFLTSDPAAEKIMETLKIPFEKIKEIADTIVSIKVSAKKVAGQETVKIERAGNVCPMCEDYAKKQAAKPVAVICCEGACLRGEVARQAANIICHSLAPEKTVRICLGGAFTKDTGQRSLVRNAKKVIAIEGCFIKCASRMMKGVIGELSPEVIIVDKLYDFDRNLFGIDEVPEEEIKVHAKEAAKKIAEKL